MPDTADAQNISVKSVNGVLHVRIPKQEKVLPRRIRVQS
jgi:HSP20 family protein